MHSGRAGLFTALLIIAVLMTENSPVLAAGWSATSVTVTQGGSGSSSITVTTTGMEFSYKCVGLPTDAVCSYASTGTTIDGHIDVTSSPKTDTVTVTTSSSTPFGTYAITLHLTACAPECIFGDTSFTLTVGTGAVGGFVEPIDNLAILGPYLAAVCLIAVATLAMVFVRNRP